MANHRSSAACKIYVNARYDGAVAKCDHFSRRDRCLYLAGCLRPGVRPVNRSYKPIVIRQKCSQSIIARPEACEAKLAIGMNADIILSIDKDVFDDLFFRPGRDEDLLD